VYIQSNQTIVMTRLIKTPSRTQLKAHSASTLQHSNDHAVVPHGRLGTNERCYLIVTYMDRHEISVESHISSSCTWSPARSDE
jgi:hypothetical protein